MDRSLDEVISDRQVQTSLHPMLKIPKLSDTYLQKRGNPGGRQRRQNGWPRDGPRKVRQSLIIFQLNQALRLAELSDVLAYKSSAYSSTTSGFSHLIPPTLMSPIHASSTA